MAGSTIGNFRFPSLLIWGGEKCGKSAAVLRAVKPEMTAWLCFDPNGVSVASDPRINWWMSRQGIPLEHAVPYAHNLSNPTDPWREAEAATNDVLALVRRGVKRAIVLDTLTVWASRMRSATMGVTKEQDDYAKAKDVTARTTRWMIESATSAGAMLIATAHSKDASPFNGNVECPKLPGDMRREVLGLFDIVLKMEKRASMIPGEPARRVLICRPDDTRLITSDRYGVCPEEFDASDLDRAIGLACDRIAWLAKASKAAVSLRG